MVCLALTPDGGYLTRVNVRYARGHREFTPEYKDEAGKLVLTTGRARLPLLLGSLSQRGHSGSLGQQLKVRYGTGETEVTESEERSCCDCAK